nr:structure-specific endonuclease subunit SLX4-like isoform X2 [Labrus bergylta]
MDDSDQDFADLCSKLLKRVRKRPGESRQARREEQLQPSNQAVSGDKTRRNNRRHGETGSRSAETQPVSKDEGGDQPVSKDEGGDQPVSKGAGGDQPVSKGAGGDQPVSKGAGGDQPVSKDEGGDQPVSKGAGGDQTVSKGAGGDQTVSKDEGGDQPVSKGAGGDQPVSKGAGGDQTVSKGAGGDQAVSKGAGGDQAVSKGAGGDQPVSKGAGGDQPVSKGAGGDQAVSKGAGGDQPVSKGAGGDQAVSKDEGGDQPVSKGAGDQPVSKGAAADRRDERGLLAKDKVLLRMQQFKRADPQRMVHKSQTGKRESDCDPPRGGLSSEPLDSDEALALRLQQELDREAAESRTVDLEEGGLFFCQICHRDLSHMTPEGRMQHLNRCLDENEQGAQALAPPPPPPPGVPECPICGKKFKSQKSRSAHLKRCSADLGVPPAVLLQAVQRQAEENQNVPTAHTLTQTGGTKRKGSSKPGLPARKKPRKKTDPQDEDTMVALALSSSLLELEREHRGERERAEAAPERTSVTSGLKWRSDTGKGRGKRKKGAAPRPPLLLLVQDANTALTRLQDRVSALLLQGRSPSPPTPTHCPSSLPGWSGAAPLWQKSTLQDGGSTCLSDFYTPELREFITPTESAATDSASCSTITKPESSVRAAAEGTPLTGTRASVLPSSSQTASDSLTPSTPGTGALPVGSQALRDLMELAEDGMTLTQCGYTASGSDGKSAARITNLRLSGFVLDESEEHANSLQREHTQASAGGGRAMSQDQIKSDQ